MKKTSCAVLCIVSFSSLIQAGESSFFRAVKGTPAEAILFATNSNKMRQHTESALLRDTLMAHMHISDDPVRSTQTNIKNYQKLLARTVVQSKQNTFGNILIPAALLFRDPRDKALALSLALIPKVYALSQYPGLDRNMIQEAIDNEHKTLADLTKPVAPKKENS